MAAGPLFAAATALQTVSILRQGVQQKAYFDFQARQNAAEAAAAQGVAAVNADIVRKAGRMGAIRARASLAKAGVDVNSGSAADLQDNITQESELDAFMAILQGRYQGRAPDAARPVQPDAVLDGDAKRHVEASGTLLAGGAKSVQAWGK